MTSCPNHLPFDNQKLDPVKRYHTEGERVGNQIDAAFIFARADFVNVHHFGSVSVRDCDGFFNMAFRVLWQWAHPAAGQDPET